MSAVMREQDRLGQMLVEWAEWKRKAMAAGYSSTDMLWRAQFGRGGEHDNLPEIWKLWANPQVRRIEAAIESLRARKEHLKLMQFVQAFYISGPAPLVSLGYTYRQMNDSIAAAHKLIRQEMRLRG